MRVQGWVPRRSLVTTVAWSCVPIARSWNRIPSGLVCVEECGVEVIVVGFERRLGMKCWKPIPDADGICRMAFANLVENCRGIGIARRRKHAIHNEVDIRFGAQGAGKSLRSTLRFRLYGAAHLEKSSVQFALPEKKIGIAPGDFGGQGISAFRMKKCVARGRNI